MGSPRFIPQSRLCLTLVAVALFCHSLAAQPLPQTANTGGPVLQPVQTTGVGQPGLIGPVKFGELTIDAALDLLEQWTGRIVLRPQALPATSLSLNISKPLPKDEAVQALETVLTMNGIAISPLGEKFLKVTPLVQARSEAPEFIEGSSLQLAPSGRVAVKLFQFKYLLASEIMPQLSGLLSPGVGAAPVVVDKANSALITDTISNLQRIETLLVQLDRPALTGLKPKFYPLTYAKASDLANSVRTILTGPLAAQVGSSITLQADDRTNQLVLVCDPRQHPFFDELIAKLDSKGETNTRQEVLHLKHAVAKDVATLLSELVSGRNQVAASSQQQSQQRNQNQSLRNQLQQVLNNRRNTQTGTQQANTPQPVAATTAAAGGEGEAATEFSSMLTILAEERSNAIVVSGTVDDIAIIRQLVDRLDVLLAQVRIEAVIAEVTLSDNNSSGIEALGLKVQADKLVGFSGSLPGIAVTDGAVSVSSTNGSRDLAATLQLTTTPRKSNSTILSTPTLVTAHNKEGVLFVGEQRPVITGYLNNGTANNGTGNSIGGYGYQSNVTYKDIGIELKVKPLIGNDGALELEITQEVNDVLGEIEIDGNAQPRIGRRSMQSFVSVRNGEVVVLGGLQRKSNSRSNSRLGPIPIIGDLLGKRSSEKLRTDLVFFLRPYILTNTAADNTEIIQRLEQGQQSEEVRHLLKQSQSQNGSAP